ncbi:MAG TPA: response regulator, partial [Myxococcota bacterium]
RLLGERRFDIIVSDQVMPSMSGTDLLGLVRRLHPEVMRVMLTGEIDRQLAIDAINESRVQGFIEKPWNNERLRAVLGGFIADARARHRARIDTAIDAVA